MQPCIEAALAYRACGWRPVPVTGKRPIGEGWAERHWEWGDFRGRNVGIVLGWRSGGLVDIDLDAPEAVALADNYLPRTATFGHESKPRSHRLYLAEAATYKKYVDPISGHETLLELRADTAAGGVTQTVVPPSVHISGELIEWSGASEPLRCGAADLQYLCSWLAIACLVRRYIEPFIDVNWTDLIGTADGREQLLKRISGGWPELGRTCFGWLDRPDPFAPPSTLHPDASVEEIVAATNNDLDWDTWVTWGLALFRTVGDAGWPIFREFSSRYVGRAELKLTRQRWASFHKSPPRDVGIGTLRYIQKEHPRQGLADERE